MKKQEPKKTTTDLASIRENLRNEKKVEYGYLDECDGLADDGNCMVNPVTMKPLKYKDLSSEIIDELIYHPSTLLDFLTNTKNNPKTIAMRGEAINAISMIFYNKAWMTFYNLTVTINNILNEQVRISCPRVYAEIIDKIRIENDMFPIDFFEYRYMYNSIDPRLVSSTYSSVRDNNNDPVSFINNYFSCIREMCIMEKYINLYPNAIKMTALAACSHAYNNIIELYYESTSCTSDLDAYMLVVGSVIKNLLVNMEIIIDSLWVDAHDVYDANKAALEGPYASFLQVSSNIAESRNGKISAFIKDNINQTKK